MKKIAKVVDLAHAEALKDRIFINTYGTSLIPLLTKEQQRE